MCRQKVRRSYVLSIWKVKEGKYVALLRLLACVADEDHRKSDSTRICCRIWIYRSFMNATSMYIARSANVQSDYNLSSCSKFLYQAVQRSTFVIQPLCKVMLSCSSFFLKTFVCFSIIVQSDVELFKVVRVFKGILQILNTHNCHSAIL